MAKIPYYYEEITLDGAAMALNSGAVAMRRYRNPQVLIKVSGNVVNWLDNGAVPTASTVNQMAVGDELSLTGYEILKNFRAIKTAAGTAYLGVHYWCDK